MEMRAESQFNSFPLTYSVSSKAEKNYTHIPNARTIEAFIFSVRQISYNSGIALYKWRVENLKRIIYT